MAPMRCGRAYSQPFPGPVTRVNVGIEGFYRFDALVVLQPPAILFT